MHVPLSMPPKYPVCQVVEFINGRSAIQIARNFQGRKKNFVGQDFRARGCHVSTAGKDEEVVRAYIQAQEKEDQRLEQLKLLNCFERFKISSHRLCRWYFYDSFLGTLDRLPESINQNRFQIGAAAGGSSA